MRNEACFRTRWKYPCVVTLTPRLWLWFMCLVNFSWCCRHCPVSILQQHLPLSSHKTFFRPFEQRETSWFIPDSRSLLLNIVILNLKWKRKTSWEEPVASVSRLTLNFHVGILHLLRFIRCLLSSHCNMSGKTKRSRWIKKTYPQRRRTLENPDVSAR